MNIKLNHVYRLSENEQVKIVRDVEKPQPHEHITILEKSDILFEFGAQSSYEAAKSLAVTFEKLRDEHDVKYVLVDDLFLELKDMDRFELCGKLMQCVNLTGNFVVSYFDCNAPECLYSFLPEQIKNNLIAGTQDYHAYIDGIMYRAIFYDGVGNETAKSDVYYGKSGLEEIKHILECGKSVRDKGVEL